MEFELGQTYSGYQFLEVVRRSRGEVQYRVQNTFTQRLESLRTLTEAAGDDPDTAERFLCEVRTRARLSHAHIVAFYTAVPVEGRMSMTSELLDWPSLAERLQLGPLPWRAALDIMRQLIEALEYLHRQSFVHCGVTPESILLGPGDFCKLAEFSEARPLDPAAVPGSGMAVGNPHYMSPEQVKGGQDLDARSDVYSAGVVLFEMLCGHPPFESRSHFELMMAHVNQPPPAPTSIVPEVPSFLDEMVLKALSKDARDRYPSAAAFGRAITSAGPSHDREGSCEEISAWQAKAYPTNASCLSRTVGHALACQRPLPEHFFSAPEGVVSGITEGPHGETIAVVPGPVLAAADAVVAEKAVVREVVVSPDPAVVAETAMPETASLVEVAVSPEPTPVLAEVAVPDPAALVEVAVSPEPTPALATVAVPDPAALVEVAESPEPASVVATVEVPEQPTLVEVAVSPEPATIMAEADGLVLLAVAASPELTPVVPSVEVRSLAMSPEPSTAVVEVPGPQAAQALVEVTAGSGPAPAAVDAVVPETAGVVEVTAIPAPRLADAVVPEAPVEVALGTEPAPAIPAPVILEAAGSPEPAPEPARTAEIIELAAPPTDTHAALWAAAVMVAEAASVHAVPPSPVAPTPLPLATPPPEPAPPAPAIAPEDTEPIPVFLTNLRRVPASLQWVVFGGTAAFLGIILAAIWFGGAR
jgi:serine/threonine-protein kinase